MTIKKLVAKESSVTEESVPLVAGEKFVYFIDPETGKSYRPRDGFVVTGKDLSKQFIEVED